MYNEKDLDLVGTSIDIFTRAPKSDGPREPLRGHFDCTDCLSKPMGARPHYTTASLINFEFTNEPQFSFVYAKSDLFYRENETRSRTVQRMTQTRHGDWVYGQMDQLNNLEIHVRGWWDENDVFIHNAGIIKLGDHVDLDFDPNEHREDGGQEFAIHTFIPVHSGTYIHWQGAETYSIWSPDEAHAKTFIHPTMDTLYTLPTSSWVKRKTPKGSKTTLREQQRPGRITTNLNDDLDMPPEVEINMTMETPTRIENPFRTRLGERLNTAATTRARAREEHANEMNALIEDTRRMGIRPDPPARPQRGETNLDRTRRGGGDIG